MFSAISNFFSRQFNHLNQAHAQVSWEEALDAAIFKISQIKEDIETDIGKYKLGIIIDELKLTQLACNKTKQSTSG